MNTLPYDILLHHLIPMLAQPVVTVDEWARRLYDWIASRLDAPYSTLSEDKYSLSMHWGNCDSCKAACAAEQYGELEFEWWCNGEKCRKTNPQESFSFRNGVVERQ